MYFLTFLWLQVYLSVQENVSHEEGEASLEEVLECVNADVKSLSLLTDFPIGTHENTIKYTLTLIQILQQYTTLCTET